MKEYIKQFTMFPLLLLIIFMFINDICTIIKRHNQQSKEPKINAQETIREKTNYVFKEETISKETRRLK